MKRKSEAAKGFFLFFIFVFSGGVRVEESAVCKYRNILSSGLFFISSGFWQKELLLYVEISPWYFLLAFFACPVTGRFSSSP